jgi:GT2 family glycosyltransferase
VNDGVSGILTESVDGLFASAERLAESPAERARMAAGARDWAQRFTWSAATDHYEAVIAEVAPSTSRVLASAGAATESRIEPTTAESPLSTAREPDVTAIILNYGADHDVLRRCTASLVAQTHPVHVLLVDNGSPKNKDAVERVKEEFPAVEVLWLDKNYGFAGGMNRGIAAARGEYVLLVNNDTCWAPNAVEEMYELLAKSDRDVVGIAPKLLLEEPEGFIDAIGNLVDPVGQAFNMGIGQLDIGQYDRVEDTFGACFAATLIRREAFRDGIVGPMDEKYFMYYEDVDWNFRAGVLGFRFLTCPTSVIYHTHSLTTRQLKYGFKYRLIMRNFVRTLLKDFQGRRAYRAAARRSLGLARNVVRGPYRWASLLALKDITLGFPAYAMRRRKIQSRRRRQDTELFNYSHGEQGFFDPTSYQPMRTLETLQAMYRRLYLITGNDTHRAIADLARDLTLSRLRFDREVVLARLRPLMADEPQTARDYLESLAI